MIGSRIGSYEIQALAGRGGMGEVYRARDSKLKRTVAIKILPSEFSQHHERLQRFQAEAEALAALNHPNIAAIHALEEDDRAPFLVLEFVEGETLAERLHAGPLPVAEVVSIARQICSALSAAHDQGIVHRDLKPANIKITPSGQVKLLDFGLAKVLHSTARELAPVNLSHSPTIAATGSGHGVIAGTAAYMSPEQARGKPIDKRTDLWALGCVLYEMTTAKPVFGGETSTDVLAEVVTKAPNLAALPPDTPGELRWVIEQCLQKDVAVRLRDAADAGLALTHPVHATAATTPLPRLHWSVAAAAGAALALAVAAAVAVSMRPAAPQPVTRFNLPAPGAPINQFPAVSPDGRHIAYVADIGQARIGLFLRTLDEAEAKALPGTETIRNTFMSPTWSPDGRHIAFVADSSLKTIELASGVVQRVAPIDPVSGITWNRDNVILFASNGHGLRRILATGGDMTAVTTRDTSLDETYHDCPQFLPDGRRFLYLAYSEAKPENRVVYLADLTSNTRTRIMASDACVVYVEPGFIVQPRGRALFARRVDPASMTVADESVQIASDVATFSGGELAAFAVGGTGTLVYRTPLPPASRTLVSMDRSGRSSPIETESVDSPTRTASGLFNGGSSSIKLSPDGKRLVFSSSSGQAEDIWTFDLERRVRLRLTTDPTTDHLPVWSPDGSQVIFDKHGSGQGSALYQVPSNGASAERVVLKLEDSTDFIAASDWSRDGGTVLFNRSPNGQPPWSIWGLSLADRKPFPYKQTPGADTQGAKLSPNGRFVAYATSESGTYQVVVQPFPDAAGGKWQVSDAGGALPLWRQDGSELFYLAPSGDLMAVRVSTERAFTAGTPLRLFRTPIPFTAQGALYDVTADGQRFLLTAPVGVAASSPLSTILNWTTLVSAK